MCKPGARRSKSAGVRIGRNAKSRARTTSEEAAVRGRAPTTVSSSRVKGSAFETFDVLVGEATVGELARPFRFLDIRMNREQMLTFAISAAAMVAMWMLLTRSPIGRAMRAVADNPQLALVRGIESERIIKWTWFIAGMLLAVGGVLIGMDRALEPPMGSNYLVGVFAAAILGGLGSPLGAFVGALAIGVASELSTLVMPPNYRIGIPLAEIGARLASLPGDRTPGKADWARLAADWRAGLDRRIAQLARLRDSLDGCIGCGCLSVDSCPLRNPDDIVAREGPGPRFLGPTRPLGD